MSDPKLHGVIYPGDVIIREWTGVSYLSFCYAADVRINALSRAYRFITSDSEDIVTSRGILSCLDVDLVARVEK